jgi:hypothetical protein
MCSMHQIEGLRDRVNDRGRWFRVGLVSTTAIAPLIARWNDLRVARHDLRKREMLALHPADRQTSTQSRVAELRARLSHGRTVGSADRVAELAPERMPAARMTSENVRLGLWLAGAGLGLVVASAGAYFLARRRLAAATEEPLLELPATKPPANGARPDEPEEKRRRWHRADPENGLGTMLPTQQGATPDIPGAAGGIEPGGPEPARWRENGQAPVDAKFVGNMHTMVYHEASDMRHLPVEENRIYFTTEEEAREMGYRRARGELSPTPEAGISPEGPIA